jgi:16S rRNA C967 or C1407 C5-methylase (RsmB/RsmF family)/NOL1/NOP2/fmu family ribosome biogenesis protein
MLPEKFISRIRNQKYIDSGSLLKALDEPSPVSIRLNPGKWNHKPAGSEQVPWCETGFYLKSRPSFTLDPLFHSGCYYPREASGMFLEEVFRQAADIKNDMWALDLCGAPGGKSIQISDLIGPSGHLVSNEVIRSRAPVLAETITKWGCSNTLVTCNDPSSFGRMEGWFDLILVDAPCSGEGMFRNSIAVNEWSQENAAHCAIRQKRIISDVWPALKENGLFIYSTCTFNPGENEENIKWLVGNNEAESLRLDISAFPGIAEIDYNGVYGYGFYPGKIQGDGFFVSAIRKKGTQQKTALKSQKRNELIPSKRELSAISGWTSASPERILKYKDEIFSVPCLPDEFMYVIKNLNVVKRGTAIASVKQEDFLPSHELALSKLLREDAFPAIGADLRKALAYLRRDTMSLAESSDGWKLLRYKEVSIGFVKKIGNRVNNYFPTDWRIRMSIPPAGEENITTWENGK